MCKVIRWLFTRCDPATCTRRTGHGIATGDIHVEPCAGFAHIHPPWNHGYHYAGVPYCRQNEVELREADAMCQDCWQQLAITVTELGHDISLWAPYSLTDVKLDVTEDITYKVPQTPRVDSHFREVDWNPPERTRPLDEGEVSPRAKPKFLNTDAGVRNSKYDPKDWVMVDAERKFVPLKTPDDPPIGFWARPRKPPQGWTGPEQTEIPKGSAMAVEGFVYYGGEVKEQNLKIYAPRIPVAHVAVPTHGRFTEVFDQSASAQPPKPEPSRDPWSSWKKPEKESKRKWSAS